MNITKTVGAEYTIDNVKVGDTLELDFQLLIVEDGETIPYDLTPYIIRCQVKRQMTDKTPVLSFTSEYGSIIKDDLFGIFTLKKTASEMRKIDGGQYFYDIVLITNSGEESTVLWGNFNIKRRVTV
jgi:hypothetical protein